MDGASGALTQQILIDIPPGRNGFQPSLSLNYDSQDTAQDSEVGYGWSIPIPYIERLNKTGSEDLYGPNAYFTSSLDGELATTAIASTSVGSAVSTSSIAYWKLNESSGNAADATGNGYTLTNTGSVSFNSALINNGADYGTSPTGKYLSISNALGITNGAISISLWVKLNAEIGSGLWIFVTHDSTTGKAQESIRYAYNGGTRELQFIRYTDTNGAPEIDYHIALGTSSWHHLVYSYNGATLSAYVDGTLVGTTTASGSGTGTYSNITVLGDNSLANQYFASTKYDEIGIWPAGLTSADVTALYNSGAGLAYPFTATTTISAPSSNLLARVDDGSLRSYTYSTSTNSWTMFDKGGNEYLFGASSQSRQSATTSQTGTVQTFKWMLEKEVDTNGNYVRYVYSKDHNQLYPSQIIYTGHGSTDGPTTITFATSSRPDATMTLLPGFEVDTNYRIAQITEAISSTTVRQYNLSYTTGNNGSRSLLSSVQENGWNESGAETSLPAWTFGYVSSSTPFVSAYGSGGGPVNSGGDYLVAADANGDGINEQVNLHCTGSSETISITPSTGSPTPPQISNLCWSYVNTAYETGTQFVDINGDGKADIIQSETGSGGSGQYEYLTNYSPSGGYSWTSTTLGSSTPTIALSSSGSHTITTGLFSDVDGTGLPSFTQRVDGQISSAAYLANGSGWNATTTIFTPPKSFPSFGSADCTNSQLVDVNGDGLPDWAYTDGTNTYVILNGGSGWGGSADSRWTIATSTVYQSGGNCYDRGMRFVDINGDGLPDFVRSYSNTGNTDIPERGTYQLVYLNTGYGWATSTAYTLPTHIIDAYNLSGTNEIGYYDYANYRGNGQQYQDVLSTSTNPKGGITSATYGYTTQSGVNPNLPFNLLVATNIVNDDGRGNKQETDYSYSGGRQYLLTNVFDRKFAGFAAVTASTSIASSTTYYSQGSTTTAPIAGDQSDGYGQLNHPYRQDTATPSGTLVQSIFFQYNPIFHGNSEFVGLTRQLEQDYASDGSHQDKDTDYAYSTTTDDLIQTLSYGQVTGNSDGTFSTSSATSLRTTNIAYAASSSINLSVSTEKTLFNSSNATTTDAKYFYDGLSFGQVNTGNQTQAQDWISGTRYASSTKAYNSYGLVATSTDFDGNATTYAYDALNLYPATTTNARGQLTTYKYNYSNGKVATSTDPNGNVTKTIYDGIGRLIETDESNPASPSSLMTKSTVAYTDSTTTPSLVHESDYLNSATTTDSYDYYDGLDRLIQERKSSGTSGTFTVTDRTYSSSGMLASQSEPYFSTGSGNTSATTTGSLFASYAYDPLGRVATFATAVGTTTKVYAKWTTTTTDPNGEIKDQMLDAFGNLVQVVEHTSTGNATTMYAYDAANNLTGITDAAGNIRNFTYDGIGDRLTAQDLHTVGDGTFGSWSYSYDDQANEVSRTDGKGQVITHTYDALNRMLTEALTGVGTLITDTYDSCPNGKGYLCTASSSASLISNAYDILGRTTTATSTIAGTAYATTYTYDRLGNPVTITNPDGTRLGYAYNVAGLVSAVTRFAGAATSSVASLFNYAPTNAVAAIQFGSGATTTYTYDPTTLYRLTRILTLGALTGSASSTHDLKLQDLNFSYDLDGNVLSRTDNSDQVLGQAVSYSYDLLNRMISATAASGTLPLYTQLFTYDALGNITSIGTSTTTSSSISYDSGLQFGGTASSYSQSYTTSTSTNRVMIVAVTSDNSGSASLVSGISYNGASLTKLATIPFNTVSSPTNAFDLWYLINPSSGTHNLTVNFSTTMPFQADVSTYVAASQASFPNASTTGAQDAGTTFSLSLCSPSCAAGAWTELSVNSQRTVTAGAGVTARVGNSSNLFMGDSNGPVSGAYTMTTNISATIPTGGAMVAIAPSGFGSFSTTTTYQYASTGYANPDAPTTIGNGLASTTLSYDNNGNLISAVIGATTTTYAYDYLNRLASSTVGSATTTYGYDAFGSRVFQKSGNTTTVYPSKWYSVVTLSAATSTGTSTDYAYLPAQAGQSDVLLATVDQPLVNGVATGSPVVRYVHTDNLGSVQATSDAGGNLAQYFNYAPFGSVLSSSNTGTTTVARQYIGQYFDSSTNLIYDNARYYNPAQGQFLTEDPSFLAVGDASRVQQLALQQQNQLLADPQQLNSYSYGRDNPVTSKDTTGNQAVAAAVPLLFPEAAATILAPEVMIPAVIGTAVVLAYESSNSNVALRTPGYQWQSFDPRRLPPSSMLGPQNILDPFGGGPPNPNPNTPKWIVGSIAAGLGATAVSQFVHPNDENDVSLTQLNFNALNLQTTHNTYQTQNTTQTNVSRSGGNYSGSSSLQSALSQLSSALTQLGHALSSLSH